jgi:hypothetical protein
MTLLLQNIVGPGSAVYSTGTPGHQKAKGMLTCTQNKNILTSRYKYLNSALQVLKQHTATVQENIRATQAERRVLARSQVAHHQSLDLVLLLSVYDD